jgi:hypothetical protein
LSSTLEGAPRYLTSAPGCSCVLLETTTMVQSVPKFVNCRIMLRLLSDTPGVSRRLNSIFVMSTVRFRLRGRICFRLHQNFSPYMNTHSLFFGFNLNLMDPKHPSPTAPPPLASLPFNHWACLVCCLSITPMYTIYFIVQSYSKAPQNAINAIRGELVRLEITMALKGSKQTDIKGY